MNALFIINISPFYNICMVNDAAQITIMHSDTIIISVASSVSAVVILSSILFFIIGYFCGRFNNVMPSSQPTQRSTDSNVIYEDVMPVPNSQDRDLKLKENLAYGQI